MLIVLGAFLLCVLVPSTYVRDRVFSIVVLFLGAGLSVYGVWMESRRSAPQPA
ncbi:MAG: hypothetical protein IPK80_01780 [Nannocystis sp.]|nr:hypothetical protein [Nannocystis sp.]